MEGQGKRGLRRPRLYGILDIHGADPACVAASAQEAGGPVAGDSFQDVETEGRLQGILGVGQHVQFHPVVPGAVLRRLHQGHPEEADHLIPEGGAEVHLLRPQGLRLFPAVHRLVAPPGGEVLGQAVGGHGQGQGHPQHQQDCRGFAHPPHPQPEGGEPRVPLPADLPGVPHGRHGPLLGGSLVHAAGLQSLPVVLQVLQQLLPDGLPLCRRGPGDVDEYGLAEFLTIHTGHPMLSTALMAPS